MHMKASILKMVIERSTLLVSVSVTLELYKAKAFILRLFGFNCAFLIRSPAEVQI